MCYKSAFVFSLSDRQVLLLLRNSKHNDNTWGLPGGNSEHSDVNLEATAMREAIEEVGELPNLKISGCIKTRCATSS